jgi:hypothetical protein
MLAEDVQFQLVGPPVAVGGTSSCYFVQNAAGKRALAFAVCVGGAIGCGLVFMFAHISFEFCSLQNNEKSTK